jgi:hypothetical protein
MLRAGEERPASLRAVRSAVMALTLRRTDISHAPAHEGLEDYTVYDHAPSGRKTF